MSRVQLEQVLRTVPFVNTLGIAVEEAKSGQVVLRLPAAAQNLAHGGVIHSGALFAVGELAASVAVGTHPRLSTLKMLQKATRIEYLATSPKDVTAHAMITAEMVSAVVSGLEQNKRAQIEVPVQLMDGHGKDVGEVVSVFTFK